MPYRSCRRRIFDPPWVPTSRLSAGNVKKHSRWDIENGCMKVRCKMVYLGNQERIRNGVFVISKHPICILRILGREQAGLSLESWVLGTRNGVFVISKHPICISRSSA